MRKELRIIENISERKVSVDLFAEIYLTICLFGENYFTASVYFVELVQLFEWKRFRLETQRKKYIRLEQNNEQSNDNDENTKQWRFSVSRSWLIMNGNRRHDIRDHWLRSCLDNRWESCNKTPFFLFNSLKKTIITWCLLKYNLQAGFRSMTLKTCIAVNQDLQKSSLKVWDPPSSKCHKLLGLFETFLVKFQIVGAYSSILLNWR